METSDCIIEGLYLGGVMAALNEQDLHAKGITHVLSVDEKPLPDVLTCRLTYRHVFALDLYDFDLLSVFPECLTYIDQARESEGRVLVHCQAGISRSSTVVIAYLMYKLNLSKQKAIHHVSSIRQITKPNDGFQQQLQLFDNMGAKVDKAHSEFRAYQLSKLAVKFQCGQYSGGVPESEIPAEIYVEPDYSARGKAAFFKCRKCRLFLFHSGALTSHNIGEGESAFDWRSKIPANQRHREEGATQARLQDEGSLVTKCVRSLFVDPLVWMKGKIHEIQGKLHCPKCDTKIGSYVWFGDAVDAGFKSPSIEPKVPGVIPACFTGVGAPGLTEALQSSVYYNDSIFNANHCLKNTYEGEKCPCGAWVAPAFHIDNGKVDKIPSQPVTPSSYTPIPLQSGIASSPSHHSGGTTPGGRPLSYVPFPERSSSAMSGRKGSSPIAAVQPRVAIVAPATVIRGGGEMTADAFSSPSSSASAASAVPSSSRLTMPVRSSPGPPHSHQPRGQRSAAAVAPLQTMDCDDMESFGAASNAGDNGDLESGINSIHMDVDS